MHGVVSWASMFLIYLCTFRVMYRGCFILKIASCKYVYFAVKLCNMSLPVWTHYEGSACVVNLYEKVRWWEKDISFKNGKLISVHLNVESLPFLTGHVVGRSDWTLFLCDEWTGLFWLRWNAAFILKTVSFFFYHFEFGQAVRRMAPVS